MSGTSTECQSKHHVLWSSAAKDIDYAGKKRVPYLGYVSRLRMLKKPIG